MYDDYGFSAAVRDYEVSDDEEYFHRHGYGYRRDDYDPEDYYPYDTIRERDE